MCKQTNLHQLDKIIITYLDISIEIFTFLKHFYVLYNIKIIFYFKKYFSSIETSAQMHAFTRIEQNNFELLKYFC